MEPTTWGVQIPSRSHGLGLKQEIPEMPRIKEEPMEPCVKQEEDQLEVSVPESSGVFVKTEESSLLQQRQTEHKVETWGEDISSEPHFHSEKEGETEHSSETDNDEDWRAPFSCGDPHNQVQIRARSTGAQNSGVPSTFKSAPDMIEALNNEDLSGKCKGAERNKHQCTVCKKRFRTKEDLQTHIRIHAGEKPFSCSSYKKELTHSSDLQYHKGTRTGKKPYSFSSKSNLADCLRTNTGLKPYSCSICNQLFTQKGNLSVHMKTHTGDKPFCCSNCRKTFTRKSNLAEHMKTHTGDKPYSCSICEKTFSVKSNLTVHMRTHTGEKLFNCLICKKDFNHSSTLKYHTRRHTDEKSYSCSICKKTFTQKSYHDMHMRTHT
ncbi:uncharacterized protein [Eucyclogobius newberryi]|uniref:uncharacterized protein isoform X4 n=1 Tax=Eucyclogobius newberryi TaxID=166745 RepID=UPI003B590AEA